MLAFDRGNVRFNFRAVGALIAEGQVLLHRDRKDDFWALPGGRVEVLEAARDAVVREFREELGVTVTVDRPLWFVENFFEYEGRSFHEVSVYFLLALDPRSSLPQGTAFDGIEGDKALVYRWFPVAELAAVALRPAFLRAKLACLPATMEAILWRDEEPE